MFAGSVLLRRCFPHHYHSTHLQVTHPGHVPLLPISQLAAALNLHLHPHLRLLSLPAAPHTMNSTADIVAAWPPPPGVIPNFTNPDSIAYQLIIVAAICPAVALVFLGLRLYTKLRILKQLLLDDCKSVHALGTQPADINWTPRLDHPCICA